MPWNLHKDPKNFVTLRNCTKTSRFVSIPSRNFRLIHSIECSMKAKAFLKNHLFFHLQKLSTKKCCQKKSKSNLKMKRKLKALIKRK